MFQDSELLAQFLNVNPSNQQVIKLESDEEKAIAYAKTHCGFISGSNISKLCTHQTANSAAIIEELRHEIAVLTDKIESSTNGKVKTATELRDSKQRCLDRLLSDDLPDGVVKFCEELAMLRMTGYCEQSDVDFKAKATQWGIDNEPLAIEALKAKFTKHEFRFANEQQQFILLNGFDYVGCTPDSVIYHDDQPFMTVDIKCPYNRCIHGIDNRHFANFADFKAKYPVYYWQFTLQMLCAGVERHLFASFDPRQPKHKLFSHVFSLNRDDADFMMARICAAERLIDEIIRSFE